MKKSALGAPIAEQAEGEKSTKPWDKTTFVRNGRSCGGGGYVYRLYAISSKWARFNKVDFVFRVVGGGGVGGLTLCWRPDRYVTRILPRTAILS